MKKNIVIVILLILVIGLAGYIGYDKYLMKEEPTKTENETVEETVEQQTTEQETVSSTEVIAANIVGAYSGIAEAPAEVGRPSETNELLINEGGTAIFCYNIGTETNCYKGGYVISNNVLYLLTVKKFVLEGTSGSNMQVVEFGGNNSYMTFAIKDNQLTYLGNLDGSRSSEMSKVDTNTLKYASNNLK